MSSYDIVNNLKFKIIQKGDIIENCLIPGSCIIDNKIFISANSGGDLSPGQTTKVFSALLDNPAETVSEVLCLSSVFRRGGTESGGTISKIDNRIFLPYSDGFYIDSEKTLERRTLLFCPVSDDSGLTWNLRGAVEITSAEAFAFGRIIKYKNELKMPVWGSVEPGDKWESGILTSLDNGETWGIYRRIAFHCNETVVESENDCLIALIRGLGISYDGLKEVTVRSEQEKRALFISRSFDGETWSKPVYSGISGTSPSICRTSSGKIFAGYRSTLNGGVCQVAMYLNGIFHPVFDLETPDGIWKYGGYPVLSEISDGRLFAIFHYMKDDIWKVAFNLIEQIN